MFELFPRPLLFGHRGASRDAPENTMDSFQLAADIGVDVLELDVRISYDEQLVVIHDETLDRTTNGHGRVRDKTYRELQRLDAAHRFRQQPGPWAGDARSVTIPRLRDVLESFPKLGFNIELKRGGDVVLRRLRRVLQETRATPERVVLSSGVHEVMQQLERELAHYPLGLSRLQVWHALKATWRRRPLSRARGQRALQIPVRLGVLPVASPRLIAAAHAAAMEVHIWAVNTPATATAWLQLGADGVISDDPGAVVYTVRQFRGRSLAQRRPPAQS